MLHHCHDCICRCRVILLVVAFSGHTQRPFSAKKNSGTKINLLFIYYIIFYVMKWISLYIWLSCNRAFGYACVHVWEKQWERENDSDQLAFNSILLYYEMYKWGKASVWSKLKNSSLHRGFQEENAILTIVNCP